MSTSDIPGAKRFKFIYSTPEQYYLAVKKEIQEKDIILNRFLDDLFPLNMQFPEHFWNGFYTSRPNFKELLRDLTYDMHSTNELIVLKKL